MSIHTLHACQKTLWKWVNQIVWGKDNAWCRKLWRWMPWPSYYQRVYCSGHKQAIHLDQPCQGRWVTIDDINNWRILAHEWVYVYLINLSLFHIVDITNAWREVLCWCIWYSVVLFHVACHWCVQATFCCFGPGYIDTWFYAVIMSTSGLKQLLITRFMGPLWGPPGADMTQVGPVLAPWTLLSGM